VGGSYRKHFRRRQWKVVVAAAAAVATCLREVDRDVIGGSVVKKFESDVTEAKDGSVRGSADDDERHSEYPFPSKM
jgi:hypothetical protein